MNETTYREPKRGMTFQHASYLDSDYSGRPLTCRVTRVAQGVVYYRPVYGKHDDGADWLGSPAYVPVGEFHRIARTDGELVRCLDCRKPRNLDPQRGGCRCIKGE